LISAGVKAGDNVILPVLTFAATANAIKYLGANPIFCDVDKDEWLIDYKMLSELMEYYYRVAAVLPVDLYANIVDIDKIHSLELIQCDETKIIVDAAESFGNRINNINADYICYSFNGNKIITAGAGGLIIKNDNSSNCDLNCISKQGRFYDGDFSIDVGYNYQMPGLNAALGLSQFAKIDNFLDRKRQITSIYHNELSNILCFQKLLSHKLSFWLVSALLPDKYDVVKFQRKLAEYHIPTRRIFRPLNQSKPFADGKSYPIAEYIYDNGICLPSSTVCSNDDIYKICEIIRKVLCDA